MQQCFLFVLLLSAFCFAAYAQTDTVKHYVPSASGSFAPKIANEVIYHPDSTHSTRKAVLYSLFVPGAGQVYNHKWWKVPVIYTGLGLLTSAVVFNQKYLNQNLALTKLLKDHENSLIDPSSPQSPDYKLYLKNKDLYNEYKGRNIQSTQTQSAYDGYKRNRDLSILGLIAGWGINVIDAYIDAKFIKSFTTDNNLSVTPVVDTFNGGIYAVNNSPAVKPGLKITFAVR